MQIVAQWQSKEIKLKTQDCSSLFAMSVNATVAESLSEISSSFFFHFEISIPGK